MIVPKQSFSLKNKLTGRVTIEYENGKMVLPFHYTKWLVPIIKELTELKYEDSESEFLSSLSSFFGCDRFKSIKTVRHY